MTHSLLAVFSPALAIGAAAAALAAPLLIHLLFRKRYQIVPWAAIRFLLSAERRHRRRIDHWVLLALRTLALLLPLLAMAAATDWAEDFWQRLKPGKVDTVSTVPRTHHVLVIDGSLSMTARTDDGRTRFERAVSQAEELIKSGNAGDGYSVILDAIPRSSLHREGGVRQMRAAKGDEIFGPRMELVRELVLSGYFSDC